MNKKLKPVTFIEGRYTHHGQNTTQQILLLNALKITQDPKKLREMIGVKTVAEVFRTLDKMAMRKEYHSALERRGISFDYLVDNIKSIIDSAEYDSDKLKGVQVLLKSLGMDKYEEQSMGGSNWEEIVSKIQTGQKNSISSPGEDYDVKQPVIPESVKKQKDEEKTEGSEKGLYE